MCVCVYVALVKMNWREEPQGRNGVDESWIHFKCRTDLVVRLKENYLKMLCMDDAPHTDTHLNL